MNRYLLYPDSPSTPANQTSDCGKGTHPMLNYPKECVTNTDYCHRYS